MNTIFDFCHKLNIDNLRLSNKATIFNENIFRINFKFSSSLDNHYITSFDGIKWKDLKSLLCQKIGEFDLGSDTCFIHNSTKLNDNMNINATKRDFVHIFIASELIGG